MSEEMYNYFLNFMYKAGALQKVIEEEEQHGKQKTTN
ncbi:hypothetical protein SAMN04487789_12112 [Staphylococcus hominis]|nr:hypothetical protein SAMN04487789_12112 [Staphylococcus hominis]